MFSCVMKWHAAGLCERLKEMDFSMMKYSGINGIIILFG